MAPNNYVKCENVAFVCWDGYGGSNRTAAINRFKIHVGILRNESINSRCRFHIGRGAGTYHKPYYHVFQHKVDEERICKFCYENMPGFWHRLQRIEEPPKMDYILLDLTTGKAIVTVTEDKEVVARRLSDLPDDLEGVNKPGGKLWLFRGKLTDVEFKIHKRVQFIRIKE